MRLVRWGSRRDVESEPADTMKERGALGDSVT